NVSVIGSIVKSSSGTTSIASLTNAGSVDVQSGTLDLRNGSPSSTIDGSIHVASGALLTHSTGTTVYHAGSSITGQGHMSVTGAAVTFDSGAQYDLKDFLVDTGTLTLNDDYTVDTVTIARGIITGSG